jgi:hypothetical protein
MTLGALDQYAGIKIPGGGAPIGAAVGAVGGLLIRRKLAAQAKRKKDWPVPLILPSSATGTRPRSPLVLSSPRAHRADLSAALENPGAG